MTIFIGNTGNSTVIYGNIAVNIIKPPDFGGAYSWDNARWLDTQILKRKTSWKNIWQFKMSLDVTEAGRWTGVCLAGTRNSCARYAQNA